MESIASVLHSSYAYLLVFQVLLVTVLSLILLGLIVKRIKLQSTENQTFGSTQEFEALRLQIASLTEERELLSKKNLELEQVAGDVGKQDAQEQAVVFKEKVKYLEAKLLEYEILQEEIGSLSALKIENERLKEVVVRLQKSESKAAPQPPPG